MFKSNKIGDATILLVSSILVNAGNYGINLILGRHLGPQVFAEVSVIATTVLMLSFLAVGIQLTSAKFTASLLATESSNSFENFKGWISQKVAWISIGLTFSICLVIQPIQNYLHFESAFPILIIALGLPLYFRMSLKRGFYQGQESFKALAKTYVLEMVYRMIATAIFLIVALQLNMLSPTMAIAIGFIFSFLACGVFTKKELKAIIITKRIETKLPVNHLLKFVMVILFYELGQILINNSDVILVKHYFENTEAGMYAALALIGRVVFFGTWTIVTLMFPKVIQLEKQGKKHSHLFWMSFGATAFVSASIILACFLMPEFILNTLFGDEFIAMAGLLWKYALATSLFACANVFAYYYMSLEKYTPVALSILAGILQVVFISFYHGSLEQVIMVQIMIMSGLFIAMLMFKAFDSRSKKTSPSISSESVLHTSLQYQS